jgi:DDE superfamily endonuclease
MWSPLPLTRSVSMAKNARKPWCTEQWGSPPEAHAACVWGMADVLEVSQRPYSSQHPLICMEESSPQQGSETRQPLPAEPGQPARYDAAYARRGGSTWFLWFAPLAGGRPVQVTDRRTKVDWAHGMKDLLTVPFAPADHITRVMDNLTTHHPASLDDAFQPEEANARLERGEFPDTPTHGSGLNMAEIACSALQRPCLDRRIPDQAT